MNAFRFKVIFSKTRNALVAVGETSTTRGKCSQGVGVRTSIAPAAMDGCPSTHSGYLGNLAKTAAAVSVLAMSIAYATHAQAQIAANALPSGASLASGSATVTTGASTLNINQTSNRASINWNSFNVGSGASVNIAQPSASAVLLNRVTGSDPSQILGRISANGQVMLVNPNGIVFGKGGSISAAALTASTMGISDADFQAGNYKFSRNASTAGIVNEGTITTAPGGYVALIGASVVNNGKIISNGGDVSLVAGETVILSQDIGIPVTRGGKVRLLVTAADINTTVSNTGEGVIQTSGGQVLMQASSLGDTLATISQSGRIDTSGARGGAVYLRADGGKISVNGSMVANSTESGAAGGDIIIGRATDGNGKTLLAASTDVSGASLESRNGWVETSGDALTFHGAQVKAKEWLLDPFDVNIDAAAASTLSTNLATTNITIETSSGTSPGVNSAGDGNITISSAIAKTGSEDHTLTLLAANGIDVNAAIGVANGASGKLHLVMTANGNAASTSNSKGLTLNSAIDANGGNIVLNGTSAFGNGVQIGSNVTSVGADITITGTSAATTTDGSNAGIYAAGGTVTGKNVTLIGSATDTAAGSRVLGYRGAGVSIQASDKLSITGSTQNLASGVYGFTGTYSAANGITIEGTSARGKGVGFDNNATLTNTSSGGISITGTSNDVTKNALGFQGVSITNASTDGSNTSLIARSGNVLTDSTSVGAWGGGVIQNTITNASGAGRIEVLAGNNSATSSSKIDGAALRIRQNSNAGVTLLTSGTGDLTVGSLENMGTGILVLAAGSQISPGGSGAGGNVKLASGSYTRANNGNLKVSTGSYDTAGAISAFNALTRTTAGFNTLYYNSPSAANNVGFNKGYSSTLINGDASNQMLFRQDKTPTFTLALTGTSAVYGRDAYPASQATELARLKSANGAVSSVTPLLSATEGSNTFTLATADVMNNLSVNRTLGARSAGGYESANIPGYAYNAGTAAVNGLQLNTTITGIAGAALVHSISKATASITASTASVVYNGATQNQATVSTGLKAGDAIQVNGTASGRNVGSYGSTLSVSGSDTANYTIALADGNMTITPAQLIVAARPNTKVVDGNTNSGNTPAITGLAAVDKLVGTPAQTYGDASIGTGKTLTPSRLAVSDGNNGNNYVVTYQPSTAGVITTIPNINPVIPAVPVNPRVKVAKGPVGSNFTLTGLEVQEACSITALEKCSCEEFTELSTRTPVSESAKDIAILICTPAAQGQAR